MKNLLFIFLIFCGLTKAQSNETSLDSAEVMLAISPANPEMQGAIKATIQSLTGASVLAYCDNHSVFLIHLKQQIWSSPELFLEQLQKLNPSYANNLLLKSGNFASIKEVCLPGNAQEAQQLKNTYTQ